MSGAELTTYAEVADIIERLPEILRDIRRSRQTSLRDVSQATGVSIASLSRFESRDNMIGWRGITALLRWLDASTTTGATNA